MKTLSTLALIAAAIAGARAADPADPVAPEQQLYAMIFTLQLSDKLIDTLLSQVLSGTDSDLEPDMTSLTNWAEKCIKGDVSVVEPTMPEPSPSDFGFTQEQLEKMDFENLTANDIKKMADGFKKYISKIKLEAKVFFVSDAKTMALPECQSSNVVFNPLPLAGIGNPFKITMFQPVASGEDFSTCVNQDDTGAYTPVCGNFDPVIEQAEYEAAKACTACSVTSNSVLASTVAAAAFVAMALFF